MNATPLESDPSELAAYRSVELTELYDAIYADGDDIGFWRAVLPSSENGPVLELGCGTGRLTLPLARDGYEITGLDSGPHMLARCRDKLDAEPLDVRDRVSLVEGDMTSFDLTRRFSAVFCAFATFHHLRTIEDQLACLERCADHLQPGGSLILDLIRPDAVPGATDAEAGGAPDVPQAETVSWTNGRRIRAWATESAYHRSLQITDCQVTYEIIEQDGGIRQVVERFPMRMVYRYEIEHLLARCGFRVVRLFGDYDLSPFDDDSPSMIVLAHAS